MAILTPASLAISLIDVAVNPLRAINFSAFA
jgi:hypothetical protein